MNSTKIILPTLMSACLWLGSSAHLNAAFPAIGYIPFPGPSGTNSDELDKNTYIKLDGGAAMQQSVTLTAPGLGSEKVSFEAGPRLDLQAGFIITTNWAAELEFGFIVSPMSSSKILEATGNYDIALMQVPILLNVIYKRPLGHSWAAYVGGGAGGVINFYENAFCNNTDMRIVPACQGQAGIQYVGGKNWDIGLGYKVLGNTGYDIEKNVHSSSNLSQSVLLTFTRKF